jgi:serine/threonine protein kinase/tetratricopeptide (TPR) repeat protein
MKICPEPYCKKTYPDSATYCSVHGAILKSVSVLEEGSSVREWIILRQLGKGGFGTVYLVRHSILQNRERALKILNPEYAGDPAFLQMLQAEAITTDKIQHPNVVEIHDVGTTEDGTPFILMEYVNGKTLAEILRPAPLKAADAGIPMHPRRALLIAIQVCNALEAAHRANIIHRDIKPGNILIASARDGDLVKVVDFGIAKLRQAETLTSAVTNPSIPALTPAYASPEQASGTPGSRLDGRSDIYSLGVVLLECLTGEKPSFPLDLRPDLEIPRSAAVATFKALAKDPQDRFQTAGEFRAALESVLPELRDETDTHNAKHDGSAAVVAAENKNTARSIVFSEGDVIAGKYRVREIISKVGTAMSVQATYRVGLLTASPSTDLCLVAVPSPLPQLRNKFVEVATAALQIHQENAATVYDVGVTDHHLIYVVSEYVEGETLRRILQREGRFDVPRARVIACQVCQAIVAAHKLSTIHSDIRPENIVILGPSQSADLRVKVIGFGTATLSNHGTPPYRSPQQIEVDTMYELTLQDLIRPSFITAATDVYSLGLVLYEMLTGTCFIAETKWASRQLEWTNKEELIQTLRNEFLVPDETVTIVLRALEPREQNRWTAQEMLGTLMQSPDTSTIAAQPAEQTDVRPGGLQRFIPVWKITPALFTKPPNIALIVRVVEVSTSEEEFTITLAVQEVLMAPEGFDPSKVIEASARRSQPNLDFHENGVHVPSAFSLQFGSEGVDYARHLAASEKGRRGLLQNHSAIFLGLLRACFNQPEKTSVSMQPAPMARLERIARKPGFIARVVGNRVVQGTAALVLLALLAGVIFEGPDSILDFIIYFGNGPARHLSRGGELLDSGKVSEAVAEFRSAVRANPDNAISHDSLAKALYRQKSYAEALQEYREALRLDPKNTDASDKADALECWKDGMAVERTVPKTFYVDSGKYTYETIVQCKTDDGRVLTRLNEFKRMEALIGQAIQGRLQTRQPGGVTREKSLELAKVIRTTVIPRYRTDSEGLQKLVLRDAKNKRIISTLLEYESVRSKAFETLATDLEKGGSPELTLKVDGLVQQARTLATKLQELVVQPR